MASLRKTANVRHLLRIHKNSGVVHGLGARSVWQVQLDWPNCLNLHHNYFVSFGPNCQFSNITERSSSIVVHLGVSCRFIKAWGKLKARLLLLDTCLVELNSFFFFFNSQGKMTPAELLLPPFNTLAELIEASGERYADRQALGIKKV
jgi:hypothetical protein